MIIKLTDSAGGSAKTLVHGIGRASATYAQGPMNQLSFGSTQQVQVTPLTRSQFALVLPRSNHQASFPFGALLEFPTMAAARVFAASHVLDTQALTRLAIIDVAGTTTYTITLHGALSRCDAQAKGVAVVINYEFTYGKIETSEVTA